MKEIPASVKDIPSPIGEVPPSVEEEGDQDTHRRVQNRVPPPDNEHRPVRVARVRDLLVEQGVGGPVEVALEEVRDAELGADKVVHEEFDALGRKG